MDSFARLLDTCSRCLCRFENLVADRTVLAAVSGGTDSTALLLALTRLRNAGRLSGPLHVCHVDHGVRKDSRATAQHVVALCQRLEVPVTVRRLQLAEGRLSEDTLRTARYAALQEVGREVGAGLLVT
ncbi:MAG: ATP-binding protein, partial [Planctomycetota bacterium]